MKIIEMKSSKPTINMLGDDFKVDGKVYIPEDQGDYSKSQFISDLKKVSKHIKSEKEQS